MSYSIFVLPAGVSFPSGFSNPGLPAFRDVIQQVPSATGPEFFYFAAGTALGMSGYGPTGLKAYTGVSVGRYAGYAASRWTGEAVLHGAVGAAVLVALSWRGYIEILWGNIKSDAQKAIDADNDGKFDMQDVKIIFRKVVRVVKSGLPFFAGCAAGFYQAV